MSVALCPGRYVGMATLVDFTSRQILSDMPGPQRAPGTRVIAQWLVYVAATLWRVSDMLARTSPNAPRGRRHAASPLSEHPDPDVRLLADLAQKVGEVATALPPHAIEDELDADLDIPF